MRNDLAWTWAQSSLSVASDNKLLFVRVLSLLSVKSVMNVVISLSADEAAGGDGQSTVPSMYLEIDYKTLNGSRIKSWQIMIEWPKNMNKVAEPS